MKNFINYYYSLNIHDISFQNGKYFFYHENNRYLLELCFNPNMIHYYYSLKEQLERYQYFFTIIENREHRLISMIDHKPYILLKLSKIQNDKISIFDIQTTYFLTVNQSLTILNHFPWVTLWENKIDYFEEWFYMRQDSYKNLYPLFHYFVGLAENALLYFKETEKSEKKEDSDRFVVSHVRVNINYELYDYYDPTQIIIDHPSRDLSEYMKSTFLHHVWDLDLLKRYLDHHYYSRYGIRVLFARILFPSFIFDSLENMIQNQEDLDLLALEARVLEFQKFAREMNLFLQEEYGIPVIPWLIKKT